MGQPIGTKANPHAKAMLERALAAPNGIRVPFATKQQAIRFRFACYSARKRTQDFNAKAVGVPISDWDVLTITIEEGSPCYVAIFREKIDEALIEEF